MAVAVMVLSITVIALIIGLVTKTCSQPQEIPHQEFSEAEPQPELHHESSQHQPASQPEPQPDGDHPWERDVRLPKHHYPRHYDLYLHPDLHTGLFSGRVTIHIQVSETSEFFVVHTRDLDITKTQLRNQDNSVVGLAEMFEYKPNQFWVVVPESSVARGNYTLSLEFNGSLTKGITGFYKSTYTNAQGKKVPIATSKFQPTYARKAFPCFDEPSFKSTFSTSLVRPSSDYIALSNMPVETENASQPTHGLTTVRFQKSERMVTYLACFIVCDFEYQEKITDIHGTKFRVYATPEQRDAVKYALDIGANITDYFANYFGLQYPLPKQDMIAIPDFVSGAMEHWGLITYRETNLLYDPEKSSSSNQQRVAEVVSHELAHQWFGNLVTLKWWNDLWLNEGFASYMEYKGVANYHTDWDMEEQFVTSDLHRVLDLDATLNSRPIVHDVSHPDQITEIFDTISYSKGASILRMLEHFMGADEFRMGIHNFLEKFKYDNAVTSDLWKELEKISSKNLAISDIMDTWTRQMGYPVLQLTRVGQGNYRVEQERYLTDPSLAAISQPSPYNYKWDIPITWITSENPVMSTKWLGRQEAITEIEFSPSAKWVKLNVGQFGFYRVNYPKEDWQTLADVLVSNPLAIEPLDRAHLINDAFSLAESGHIAYDIPLSMTKYLKKETHLVPWETVFEKLIRMSTKLRYTDAYPLLRKYLVELVSSHYESLGWKDEGTHLEKLNRQNILDLACRHGHAGCLEEAGRLFQEWLEDEAYIPPNLRSLVYRYGMESQGDPLTWDKVFDRFLNEKNAQEKKKLLYGLARFKEPWVLHRFVQMAKNESNVRSQDYFSALRYISYNPVGTPIVWDFLQSEWSYLVDRFGLNDRYLGRMPKSITANFVTEFQLKQVREFFSQNPEAGAGERSRKQAIEGIQNNIKFLADHKNVIKDWLHTNT